MKIKPHKIHPIFSKTKQKKQKQKIITLKQLKKKNTMTKSMSKVQLKCNNFSMFTALKNKQTITNQYVNFC